MRLQASKWPFWAAIFAALLLFALAASTPVWVARVPGAKLTSVDPQLVVGLVSVLLAVLTLVGGAVFYLLRLEVAEVAEVERSIAERVERDITVPVEIATINNASFAYFLDYSNRWMANGYKRDMQSDYVFRWSVFQTVKLAKAAHEKSQLLLDGDKHKELHLETTSSLAYHLATQYLLEEDERDGGEALTLAKVLEPGSSRDWEFKETIAWVKMSCNKRGTVGYIEGLAAVSQLMEHKDISLQWRLSQREKYNKVFQAFLPMPS